MPCFLSEKEESLLVNKIQAETDIEKKKIKSKEYEDYKACVELITPLIIELRRYCPKPEIDI